MITTLIIIYLVSVIGAYKTIQYFSYNKNGYFYGLDPDFQDFIFMLIPIFNTLFILFYWIFIHKYKNKITDWNKFFNRW